MNYKKTQTKLETWWICEQNQKFDKEIATIKNFKLKKKNRNSRVQKGNNWTEESQQRFSRLFNSEFQK